ncbi:MAG: GNAT family N-acetyltransferase [Proteobacteria bacterium]|nr:GNAT family N-acetyltransferase [Pseudomonadota bacterium]
MRRQFYRAWQFYSAHPKKTLSLTMGFGLYAYGSLQRIRAQDPGFFYKKLDINLLDEKPLKIEVTTPTGLRLRPALKADLDAYDSIYSDAKTMVTYSNGPETRQQTATRLERYEDRVNSGYVWTGYAIEKYDELPTWLILLLGPKLFKRLENFFPNIPRTTVIGHIAIGNGDEPGEVQLGIVIGANIQGKNYQGQGHGKNASRAAAGLTLFYAERNKAVTINDQSNPVTKISATARRDNIPSQKILMTVWGMKVTTDKLDDDQRQLWSTSASELKIHIRPKL